MNTADTIPTPEAFEARSWEHCRSCSTPRSKRLTRTPCKVCGVLPPPPARKKSKRREHDEAHYADFVIRCVERFIERSKDSAADSLKELVRVEQAVKEAKIDLVHYLRSEEGGSFSWAEIGDVLGVDRTTAQQVYGGPGARKVGAQPADLRRHNRKKVTAD